MKIFPLILFLLMDIFTLRHEYLYLYFFSKLSLLGNLCNGHLFGDYFLS